MYRVSLRKCSMENSDIIPIMDQEIHEGRIELH